MQEETVEKALAIPAVPSAQLCNPGSGAPLDRLGRGRVDAAMVSNSVCEIRNGIATLGLHDFVAQQFCVPEGITGYLVGALMGLINHLPNRRAIELLDIAEDDDVLEIGFGPGLALKTMARLARSGTIIGIDWSPTMFRQAQVRNREAIENGRLKLIHGSFERLPLESASVDKLLAVNVLYFCSPTGSVLREARRVLRPGGTMSIYTTDCSYMKRFQFIGPETRQTFDRKELEGFLGQSAFAADQIEIQTIRLPLGFRGLVARLCKR